MMQHVQGQLVDVNQHPGLSSRIVDEVRRNVGKALSKIPLAEGSAATSDGRDVEVCFPQDTGAFRSASLYRWHDGRELGAVRVGQGRRKEPVAAYLLAALVDGTTIESFCLREQPRTLSICLNGAPAGSCEVTSGRSILHHRIPRTWRISRGGQPYGVVEAPGYMRADYPLPIVRPDGLHLPMNLCLHQSVLRGCVWPLLWLVTFRWLWEKSPNPATTDNLTIPSDAPSLPTREENLFYFAVALLFRMVIFDFDFDGGD